MKLNFWKVVSLILVIIIIVFWWFCCNRPANQTIRMHELYYPRTKVEAVLSNPDFKKLILQFHTADISQNPESFDGIAYVLGYDSAKCKLVYINGKIPDTLKIVKDSVQQFSGPAVFGNLELTRSDLFTITRTIEGNVLDYDSLYCRPMKGRYNHIWYYVYAVKNGVKVPHTPQGGDYGPNFNPRPPED